MEAVDVGGGASACDRQELGCPGGWVHPSVEVIEGVMGVVGVSSDGFIAVEVLDGWMAVPDPDCDPAFEGACAVFVSCVSSSGSGSP